MDITEMHKVNCFSSLGSFGRGVSSLTPTFRLSYAMFACLCMVFPSTELWCSPPPMPDPVCDVQVVFRLADAELKRHHYDQAERQLDRLLGCKTIHPIETFNLGWLYGRAHDFGKALGEFNEVRQDVPDIQTHQYAVALAQFELMDYKAAVETLTNG